MENHRLSNSYDVLRVVHGNNQKNFLLCGYVQIVPKGIVFESITRIAKINSRINSIPEGTNKRIKVVFILFIISLSV